MQVPTPNIKEGGRLPRAEGLSTLLKAEDDPTALWIADKLGELLSGRQETPPTCERVSAYEAYF